MEKSPIQITSTDPILQTLAFKPYRSFVERRVEVFTPSADEPKSMELATPWGEKLSLSPGDLLVSDIKNPEDRWPVRADIFDASYIITRPGYCIKRAITELVPLTELTGGDEDQELVVYSLEGSTTVRAGDFYLARGVKGEIWAYPREKVGETMIPAED